VISVAETEINEENSNNSSNIAIIFHSGSYDRIYHGLTIGLTSLAFDMKVKYFFTYWSLEYVRKMESSFFKLDEEAKKYNEQFKKHMEKGHIQPVQKLLNQLNDMGADFYACTNSLDMLKISNDQMMDGFKAGGLGTFIAETEGYRVIFI
jgi:peroxiredoxin family protein